MKKKLKKTTSKNTIETQKTKNKGTKNTRTHDKGQTPDQRAQPRTKETEQVQSTKPKSS